MLSFRLFSLSVSRAIEGWALTAVQSPHSVPVQFGPEWFVVGLTVTGLLALTVDENSDDRIRRLTEQVKRVTNGDQSVEFASDRDDSIGELFDAVGDLVDSQRACEHDVQAEERYRERLYEIMSDSTLDRDDEIHRLLELGCERLRLENGHIAEIDVDENRHEITTAQGSDFVTAGTVTDLSETFCRRTITSEEAFAVYNSPEQGYENDPAYQEWDIGCYVGAKILVGGELFGTVCFVDQEPREEPYSQRVKAFVELLSRWIGYALERRAREAELERKSSLLDSLFEQIPVNLYVKDTAGRHVRTTTPYRDNNYPDEEEWYVGRTDLDIYPEELAEQSHADDMEVIESGDPILQKPEYNPDTGEWVLTSKVPWRDDDGEIRGLIGISPFITDQKERERELRQEKERFESLVREVEEYAIFMLDPDGYVRSWNEGARRIKGYSEDEILGEPYSTFYTEGDRAEGIPEETLEAAKSAGSIQKEGWRVRADGSRFWANATLTALRDADGDLRGFTKVTRDMTERKEYERELERTTDLLRRAEQMADIGGWSTDVSGEPPFSTEWTDKLYDIFEISSQDCPPTEDVFEYYHPEDRDRHRQALDDAMESGEEWDQELRLTGARGTERWVHNIGKPVVEDGRTVEIRGSIQDITERKEREFALESLHESARGLLTTEETAEAADLVVNSGESVLDVSGVGIYLYDQETNLLEPEAVSAAFEDYCESGATAVGPDDESFLWHSFVTDSLTVIDDADPVTDGSPFVGTVGHGLVVPIGSHGIFVAVDDSTRIDESTRRLVETLVATSEAAFDRIQSEAALRERDAEIETQNERLRRQVRINETIRSVDQSLIGAASKAELEADVCEQLTASEDIAFVWIGGFDSVGDALEPRAWAGLENGYLDAGTFDRSSGAREPAVETAVTGEPTVVSNVAADVQREDWRKAALAAEFQSVLSVPIALEGYSYGVLSVYATEPRVFGDLEAKVFAELGESIANAITSVTTKRALHADTIVSLSLRLEDANDVFSTIARSADCTVCYEGLATQSADETRVFVRTKGADSAAVSDVLEQCHGVHSHRSVSESEDGALFELTIQGTSFVSKLVRHGGRPQSVESDADGLSVEVDVPASTDVRAFVEMLEADATVELVGRREETRSLQTKQGLVDAALEQLTDRQREILRTAYYSGFFNWPRDTTGEEIADMFGVSQPTVNRHLRLGEQRIMRQLFEGRTESAE